MKKHFILLLFILPLSIWAQKAIKGTVLDNTNQPLPDVSVVVKGTTTGTVTDFDGLYTLNVKETPAVLVFSYVGFKTQEIQLTNQSTVDVVMEEDGEQLQEVVVVGYGTSAKNEIAGTVSEVKEKSEVAAQYTSVASLLQGRTSGLKVTSNTGSPGAAVSIRIRGANSLRGNNEPLYVVDGVIINSAGEDVANATTDANELQQTQNGLTGINPRDIESMVILKDASATAIYGSRGANGVVLITTKKGKKGEASINVFGSTSIINITKKIDVLNGVDYADYRNQAAALSGFDPSYEIEGDNVYLLDSSGNRIGAPLRQVNWQDDIYKSGYNTNAGFNMSGATDKNNYYLSLSGNRLEGAVPNTFLDNANLRINYSNNVTDKLKLDTKVGLYTSKGNMSQGASKSGGSRSFTRNLVSYNPLVDGELSNDDPDLGNGNPFLWLKGYEEKIKENRLNAAIKATYKITDNFKYQLNLGTNYRTKHRSRWYENTIGKGQFTNGYLALSDFDKTAYTVDNLFIYKKRFNSKNKINATVGVTFDGSKKNISVFEAGDFPINNLRDIKPELGQIIYTPYTTVRGIEDNVFSYLGRITYTLNRKYVFNASFRADKSSKFKGANKNGYFPAASFAWHINKENFLEDSKVFSKLKFRASWGQVGNQAIKPYQTFDNFGSVYYADANNATTLGVTPLNIANDDLTWETTTQTNIGLDYGLFDNKITSSIDVYQKKTSDLLISKPIPSSSGFSSLLVNQGGLENKGVEFSLDAVVKQTDDLSFTVGGNISFNKSKITDLSALPSQDIYIDGKEVNVSYYLGNKVSTGGYKEPANAFIEGQPIGIFWGYKTDGIYRDQETAAAGPTINGESSQAGDVIFVDVNGDGVIDANDKTNIGDPNPDFTYGFNANLAYKGLSLDLLFNGVYGNEILNGNLNVEGYAVGTGNNIRTEAFKDAWSADNPNGAYPRIGYKTATTKTTDRLIEDGSYLRLSNVTLSYNYSFKEKSVINGFKVYASANNLLTFTNYSGYDPEITSFQYDGTIQGVDWVGTPNVSSYVIGVNVKF